MAIQAMRGSKADAAQSSHGKLIVSPKPSAERTTGANRNMHEILMSWI